MLNDLSTLPLSPPTQTNHAFSSLIPRSNLFLLFRLENCPTTESHIRPVHHAKGNKAKGSSNPLYTLLLRSRNDASIPFFCPFSPSVIIDSLIPLAVPVDFELGEIVPPSQCISTRLPRRKRRRRRRIQTPLKRR